MQRQLMCPGFEHLSDIDSRRIHGQRNDPDPGLHVVDLRCCFYAIQDRHPDVHQNDIGFQPAAELDHGTAISGLSMTSISSCSRTNLLRPSRMMVWSSVRRIRMRIRLLS